MAINQSDYETTVQITQFAGIDQRQGDSAVSLNYAYRAQNVHTERGMLESAGGYEAAMPPTEAAIGTLARFYRRNMEDEAEREVFVAATLDGIYTWTAGTDAWVRRYPTEGTLYRDRWSHVTYEAVRGGATVDVLLLTNNEDGMVILYGDDLSAQALEINLANDGKTLKFAHIERHNERIWGCGQPGEPDNLYYSKPYDVLDWNPVEETPELGGGVIAQPTWDGDEFIALRRFGAYLAACKRNSMWLIRGTDPSTFTIEEVYGSDAPSAAASIAVDGAQMFYLSESGIGVYDGSSAQLLSRNALFETMALRTTQCGEKAAACVARHVYYLALPIRADAYESNGIENNTIIEYDTLRGTFMLRTGIQVRSMYAAGGEVYFTTGTEPYQVYKLGSGTGYNGQDVTTCWETGWFDLGGKNVQKSAFEIRFYAKGESGATMTITVETEKKEKQKSIALYEGGRMQKPHFRDVHTGMRQIWNALMEEYQIRPGYIENAEEAWKKVNETRPNYLPTHAVENRTVREEGRTQSIAKEKRELRRAMAGDRDLIDPIETFVTELTRMAQQSAKMEVKNTIARVYDEYEGQGQFFREIGKEELNANGAIFRAIEKKGAFDLTDVDAKTAEAIADQGTETSERRVIVAIENGKARYFEVLDQAVYNMLARTETTQETGREMRALMGVVRTVNNFFRGTTTVLNPFFGVKNMVRDLSTAMVFGTQENAARFFGTYMKSLAQSAKYYFADRMDSDEIRQFAAMGGLEGDAYGHDVAQEREKHRPFCAEGAKYARSGAEICGAHVFWVRRIMLKGQATEGGICMKKRICTAGAVAMLAFMLGGCAAQGAAPSPEPTQTATVSPTATSSPSPTNTPAPTREPLPVKVEGKALSQDARTQQGKTMLPLLETMELLGYKARMSELSEDDGTRRVHTFTKDKEEISVSYLLTDNTVSDVSFVRDKLIVPVDRMLLFEDETVFAPANFFEEAAGVYVSAESGQVSVSMTQPDPSQNELIETTQPTQNQAQ